MIELTEEQKQFAAGLAEVAIRTKYEEEQKAAEIGQKRFKCVLKVVGVFVGIYIALVFLAAFTGQL